MAYGAGGTAAAAHAAAVAQTIKASGTLVKVSPEDFMTILNRTQKPLVVMSQGGIFKRGYHYLTSYKGLAFYTDSPTALYLPGDIELITAKQIWIPG